MRDLVSLTGHAVRLGKQLLDFVMIAHCTLSLAIRGYEFALEHLGQARLELRKRIDGKMNK